jgi:hypothetical protein
MHPQRAHTQYATCFGGLRCQQVSHISLQTRSSGVWQCVCDPAGGYQLPLFRDTQWLHSQNFTTYTQAGVPESRELKQETNKTTAQIFNTVKPSNLKPSFFKFPKSHSFTTSYLIYLVCLSRTLLQTSVLKDNITTHQAILRSRSCAASHTEFMATLSIRHATAVTTVVRANCNIVGVTNKPHKFRH